MRYTSIVHTFFRSPEIAAANDAEVVSWLRLMVFASEQENGGRIEKARTWSARRWLRTTHVSKLRIDRLVSAGLAAWDGDALVVAGYDVDNQKVYLSRRTAGRKGANKRWGIAEIWLQQPQGGQPQ